MERYKKNEVVFESVNMMEKTLEFLLVEDNPGDVVLLKELLLLSGLDFTLKNVTTLRETLLMCVDQEFDVILLDLGLTDSSGMETLKKIKLFSLKSPVVIMTGLDDEYMALEALREGAQDYLIKGRITPDNILRSIKYAIERKKIQELLKKNARQFSLLSSTTSAINECEEISVIYSVACRNLYQMIDNAAIIAIELSNRGSIHTSGISSQDLYFNHIRKITGLNLYNPVIQRRKQKGDLIELFRDGKLHKVPYEFKNSEDQSEIPENLYAVGFAKVNKTYGGVLILTPNELVADDINIIESISNQVSLSLHRKYIEMDLKTSKDKYRKLNRGLEEKVRERTHELENLNYQLNEELVERHIVEEALRKSETRLKELNATKDKFFSIIAHDLKNPFTCLLGSTELLSQKLEVLDKNKIGELVQILNDSAKSGYEILLNLLDWSRSQTGLIRFNPERIDLRKVIDANVSDLKASSAKKNIEMISEVTSPVILHADKNMMNSIMRNLLGNAIKFTNKSGIITISADSTDREAIVSVRDTGIGIPQDKIGELFRIDTKFTRPGTSKESGTGLGLKLCKEFVEMQGGKIWVESKVNEGSKFFFTVPFRNE